jgi:hypothetical protein
MEKKLQGKKNRREGAKFELLARKDLESKGWIVAKWQNNVEFLTFTGIGLDAMFEKDKKRILEGCKKFEDQELISKDIYRFGKLIPAKHKFCGVGRPMAIGTGFPDFIAYKFWTGCCRCPQTVEEVKKIIEEKSKQVFFNTLVFDMPFDFNVTFIECKTNGKLSKEEKAKAEWYLKNNYCSKFLIASRGDKKGEIRYEDFVERKRL